MGVSLLLAECQGGRGPTNRVTKKREKKRTRKQTAGLVGVPPLLGGQRSLTRIWRLIVVVGVEVSEVGVGVGFPGELRVKVLVPLLQHQVVFVEGLRDGEQRAQWWGRSQRGICPYRVIIQRKPRWDSRVRANPSALNRRRRRRRAKWGG